MPLSSNPLKKFHIDIPLQSQNPSSEVHPPLLEPSTDPSSPPQTLNRSVLSTLTLLATFFLITSCGFLFTQSVYKKEALLKNSAGVQQIETLNDQVRKLFIFSSPASRSNLNASLLCSSNLSYSCPLTNPWQGTVLVLPHEQNPSSFFNIISTNLPQSACLAMIANASSPNLEGISINGLHQLSSSHQATLSSFCSQHSSNTLIHTFKWDAQNEK